MGKNITPKIAGLHWNFAYFIYKQGLPKFQNMGLHDANLGGLLINLLLIIEKNYSIMCLRCIILSVK